jgi:hypothetical protein
LRLAALDDLRWRVLLKFCRYLLESLFIPISDRKVKSLTRFGNRLEQLRPWPAIIGFTVG